MILIMNGNNHIKRKDLSRLKNSSQINKSYLFIFIYLFLSVLHGLWDLSFLTMD